MGKVRICIDPGHGGVDPGAVGSDGTLEKTITLAVSKRLVEYLRRGGVTSILTRNTDTDVSPGLSDVAELKARGKISNDFGADYFLSIHVDSFTDPAVSGYKLFYWPGTVKGIPFAGSIARTYGIASGIPLRSISPKNYLVFNYADCPTVLIELGFISNKFDRSLLVQSAFQDKIALGIAFGIFAMEEV